MDIQISNEPVSYLPEFPQHLCNMCGKCCLAITTPYPHDEIVKLAQEGQEEAKVFVEIFKRYDSIDDARARVPDHVENILNMLRQNPSFDESKVTFYYCPHLTEDNKCSIHKTRPDCCRRAPRNGWSLFPPDCGFKGWQFQQRERIKSSVRHLKEYMLELDLLEPDFFMEERNMTALQMKEMIAKKIKPWEKYGGHFW